MSKEEEVEYLNMVPAKDKANALLDKMAKETGKVREELVWEAVQLLWVEKDYH